MIGKITTGGCSLEATLEDNGMWKCEDDSIENLLNVRFPLHGRYGYDSPAVGNRGAACLHDAAEYFGGKMEYLAEVPKHDPNVEY